MIKGKLERSGEDFAVRLSGQDVRALGLSDGQTVEVTAKDESTSKIEPLPGSGRRYVGGMPILTLAEMIAEMDRLGPSHRPDVIDWGPDVGAEILRDDY